ncbi:hypothetical protein Pmani_000266 [Petrolisthes manimaculis]|uniref:Phorbol-ester/DAG-type domain-containing protein n=1 Tax=Petrolisthes manimaculis TaxID=1843537 RepID=A0AAE1QN74_9EUCA|nr:hypothetical protein Pmani_000266 [Petrolisthes manimaculis]
MKSSEEFCSLNVACSTVDSKMIFFTKPSTVETQRHVFKAKKVKKARPCHVCHQPVLKLGSCCRVCKYMVHKACEPRVSTK